jgi:signal transduction histidine kinase
MAHDNAIANPPPLEEQCRAPVLEAIRRVHQLIIREREPRQLIERICKLMVDSRGYTNAWAFLVAGPLGPPLVIEEGLGADFAALSRRLENGMLPGCCVDATDAEVAPRDPATSCHDCPLTSKHNPHNVLTAELRDGQRSFGFLCVSTVEPMLDPELEHELFAEISADIAFALNRLVLEKERDDAVRRQIGLARKVLATQEQERARLSRELHDELGQILTALRWEIDMLGQRSLQPGSLQRAEQIVQQAVRELRRICRGLRPIVLDDLGLEPAIKALVGEFESWMGQRVILTTRLGEIDRTISSESAVCVFRVLQEALNNVARHASAERIWVEVYREDDEVVLKVEDDGCGFDMKRMRQGLGLQGMRERSDLLSGQLDINSTPGEGTLIRLVVALARKAELE